MKTWKSMAIPLMAMIALSAAVGMQARNTRELKAPGSASPSADVPSLPPVVVFARRPTLSEILNIVLRERPTAAQLASSGNHASNGFPAGSDEAHVAVVLGRYTSDASLVHRIAAAIVQEGRRRNIGSSLLVGVLLTENPSLDPNATSPAGARGLMQVMPFHAGKWQCASPDLFDVEANICHGVAVLADNLAQSRNLPQALLAYNGCVRGSNTPDCWKYPRVVYHYARKGTAGERAFETP